MKIHTPAPIYSVWSIYGNTRWTMRLPLQYCCHNKHKRIISGNKSRYKVISFVWCHFFGGALLSGSTVSAWDGWMRSSCWWCTTIQGLQRILLIQLVWKHLHVILMEQVIKSITIIIFIIDIFNLGIPLNLIFK